MNSLLRNLSISDPTNLKELIGGRELYFWGARHGYGMCQVFKRLGFVPKGFIDSSKSIAGTSIRGYPVFLPEDIINSNKTTRPFIVITSSFFADEISAQCRTMGLQDTIDFIPFTDIQKFDYQVDISGICNLYCISCPRGNMPRQPDAGFMSAQKYEQILNKILREDPFTGVITLYNWGEPLLNPELAKIVSITNQAGVLSAISSNLNIKRDFSDVIKAQPTWFRISVSGYEASYEITHTGGNWELLLKNMHLLKSWREQYHPDMIVEMFYHIYKHNNRDDFKKMKRLCEELGFSFRYRHAALAPLDNIEAVIEGTPLSAEAQKAMELQILPVHEAMEIAREQIDRECYYERCLWITWDSKIAQCMEWYDRGRFLIEGDFTEIPLEQITEARKSSQFCIKCKERAIHRCFVVYGDEKLIEQRKSLEL